MRVFSARQSRDLEPDQCKQKEKDDPRACNQSAGPFTGEAYQNPYFFILPYETAVRQWTQ